MTQDLRRDDPRFGKARYHSGGIVGNPGQPPHVHLIRDNPEHILPASRVAVHVKRAIAETEAKRKQLIAQIRQVQRRDVLFLHDQKLVVTRVQRNPGDLDVYVCTSGAKTWFVLESEIGSHQHWRHVNVLTVPPGCRSHGLKYGALHRVDDLVRLVLES